MKNIIDLIILVLFAFILWFPLYAQDSVDSMIKKQQNKLSDIKR